MLLLASTGFSQSKIGYRYIKNEGQWDEPIKFKVDIPGGQLYILETGLEYHFYDTKKLADLHGRKPQNKARLAENIELGTVKVDFLNAQKPLFQTKTEFETSYNFFQGDDQSRWRSNVKSYGEVTLENIYEGINLRLYSLDKAIKYEYIVQPNADYSKIKMKYQGQNSLVLDKNTLNFSTKVNTFKEFQPYSFQEINGKNQTVESGFKLIENEVSFKINSAFDKSKPLIIDPELVFSTYSGSVSDNWAQTAAYDIKGNLYAGGSVFGNNFPVTKDVFQDKVGGVSQDTQALTDVVIMKYSSDGSKLLYATYLGGRSSEVPHSMISNSRGELVVFGTTSSNNFPLSSKAYQKKFGGGISYTDGTGISFPNGSDMFVAVLSENGDKLIGSTYIGGSGNDGYNQTFDPANPQNRLSIQNYGDEFRGEVVVDEANTIFVGSITNSLNFPLVNPSKKDRAGLTEGVVLNLTADCSDLKWSTLVGGKSFDAIYSLKVSKSGAIYACGGTASSDLPTNSNAVKSTFGGVEDGFIVKYSASKALEKLTYLGTDKGDIAYLLDLDADENVHVFGLTKGEYPITAGVFSNAKIGQFIHSVDKNLVITNFSTVFGSGRNQIDIVPTAFLVNDCGNIYLSGWGGKVNQLTGFNTASSTVGLPVTNDAYQKTTTGSNFYLMILEKGAKKLIYGSFFGSGGFANVNAERGDHVDGGTCRFDKKGVIYHVNCACQPTGDVKAYFPVTKNAISSVNGNENCNMASFKFDTDVVKISAKADKLEGCQPLTVTFENTSQGGKSASWDFGDGSTSKNLGKAVHIFEKSGTFNVKFKILNTQSCGEKEDSVLFTVKVLAQPSNVSIRPDTTVCSGTIVKLFANGGNTYKWNNASLLSNENISNPITKAISATTVFNVEIDNGGTCKAIQSVKITVDDSKKDFIVSKDTTICSNQKISLSAQSAAQKIEWKGVGLTNLNANTQNVQTNDTQIYTVQAFYGDGCKPIKQVKVTIDDSKPDFKISSDKEICKGQTLSFNVEGNADKFVWNSPTIKNLSTKTLTIKPLQTEIYTVQAFYKDGCSPSKTVKAIIDLSFKPDFNIIFDEKCGQPNVLNFENNTASNATRFVWKWTKNDSLQIRTPIGVSFEKAGNYAINLKAYNKIGCELNTTKNFDLPAVVTTLSNAITPNNDGKNDTFKVPFKEAEISIFNREGQLIFNEVNYQNNWGTDVNAGVYFYQIKSNSGLNCKGWLEVFK